MQDMQDINDVSPYLDQLEERCAQVGLTLEAVCKAEGIADTTPARWRKGEAHCRYGVAAKLVERIRKMVADRSAGAETGRAA